MPEAGVLGPRRGGRGPAPGPARGRAPGQGLLEVGIGRSREPLAPVPASAAFLLRAALDPAKLDLRAGARPGARPPRRGPVHGLASTSSWATASPPTPSSASAPGCAWAKAAGDRRRLLRAAFYTETYNLGNNTLANPQIGLRFCAVRAPSLEQASTPTPSCPSRRPRPVVGIR